MRRWRAAAGGACVLVVLCLAGCASVTRLFKADDAIPAAQPQKPAVLVYRLEVEAPGELRTLLTTYLDLARFQNAPESEDITPAEVDRLIAAAPAQVRSLLETEGYFNPEVQVGRVGVGASGGTGSAAGEAAARERAEESPENDPAAGPREVPLLRVRVTPGPRAIVDRFTFKAKGPLQDAADGGSLDAKVLLAQVRNSWRLPPDYPFRQPDWSSSKNGALAKLRADGYPAAILSESKARVDAQANTVQLDVTADSGVLYRLGPLDIRGLQRYDEDTVRKLSTLKPGTPYRESQLLDYQERLQKSGLFEGASVVLDVDAETSQAAPVNVRVRELPLQQATFGAGYSANTGPRVTAEHTHRQPFGWRWIAKNKAELGPDLKSWNGELTSYPLDGLYRNLIAGNAEQLKTVDEIRTSWTARIGRTQDTPRIERLYYGEFTHSRLETSSDDGTTTESNDAVSGNYHWIYRDLDSVLLPTEGYTLNAQAALGYARSGKESNGPFGRFFGRYTGYHTLGSSWYATTRVEAGQVLASNAVGIPDTLLFRAGGDDSVRGYAYRSLGPKVDGALLSGRMLLTGSAEIARPISPRLPALWGAAFIDAGNAADSWQNLSPVLGYGVGLRWRSPVGPLRLDLAYGQSVQKIRMHLSVGIAL